MLCRYKDIRDQLGEPMWFDECGVPRYCKFTPDQVNNIYANEVVLVDIACQNCGNIYKVAFSSTEFQVYSGSPTLKSQIEDKSLHFGDPPCDQCASGSTMNCDDLKVLEYWCRGLSGKYGWHRLTELEISLESNV